MILELAPGGEKIKWQKFHFELLHKYKSVNKIVKDDFICGEGKIRHCCARRTLTNDEDEFVFYSLTRSDTRHPKKKKLRRRFFRFSLRREFVFFRFAAGDFYVNHTAQGRKGPLLKRLNRVTPDFKQQQRRRKKKVIFSLVFPP